LMRVTGKAKLRTLKTSLTGSSLLSILGILRNFALKCH
jgi:hypothetical protein